MEMSGDRRATSTDALADEFARLAKLTRSIFTLDGVPAQTSERAARFEEIKAVGAELRARRPVETLRRLCDSDDDDVRFFAGLQFLLVDEEWALAALSAGHANMPTRELVALFAKARSGPPERPTPKEMSIEQLAARFADAGMRRFATHFMGDGEEAWDVELSNRIMMEMGAIARQLELRGALSALLPLLHHANICVRNDAAACCLPIAPDQAVPILEAIKVSKDAIESRNSASRLNEWRARSAPPAAAGMTNA
jgi:Domain of unknown function (DUF2019)